MRALVAALLLGLGGCADAVDPTLGTEQAFSLYGYLDPTADRQALRVVPITGTIAPALGPLDATVTSVEPQTGRTAVWRDTLVTFDDGSQGVLVVADYTPTPGARVEIAVRAPDGGRADVAVDVPPLVRPTVGPPLAEGAPGRYPVTAAGVPRLHAGTLHLSVLGVPGAAPDEVRELAFPVSARALEIREAGGAWTATVPFVEATRAFLEAEGLLGRGLRLREVEFRPFVADAAWAVPEGGFDLDAIVEPGTFSNVAGGFGFVGAGYRAPVRWVPGPTVQVLAGFAIVGSLGGQLAINEIGRGYVELFNPTSAPVPVGGLILTPGLADEGVVLPDVEVPAGGFFVVNGPFDVVPERAVQLLSASGALIKQAFMNEPDAIGAAAWGAYPDGYSYRPPQAERDQFYGPVVPSAGAPNALVRVPAVVNEVFGGAGPFVEVVPVRPDGETFQLAAFVGGELRTVPALSGDGPLVSDSAGVALLDPLGGELLLRAGPRFVDVRPYGPRSLDRSEGYLPDGPQGAWTPGLRPTRGAPNAEARLGR